MTLTSRILLAMVFGIPGGGPAINLLSDGVLGVQVPRRGLMITWSSVCFDIVGRIFVASLKLLVVPLVFVSLICGVTAPWQQCAHGTNCLSHDHPVSGNYCAGG